MKIKISTCLIFAISLNLVTSFKCYDPTTKRKNLKPKPKPSPLNTDLDKIKPWSCQEKSSLLNNLFTRYTSDNELLYAAAITIGLQEMRESLGFPPPPKWSSYDPSKEDIKELSPTEVEWQSETEKLSLETARNARKEELESAPSVLAYYELREPEKRILKEVSEVYAENVQIKAVKYLDQREPVIREVFKREFERVRKLDSGVVDREVVDRMVVEFARIYKSLKEELVKKVSNWESQSSDVSTGNFTFIHNDSLMSNPNKLLESIKPKTVISNSTNIDTLLDSMDCLSDKKGETFWHNTLTTHGAERRNLYMTMFTSDHIFFEEMFKAIGVPRTPTADDELEDDSVEEYLVSKSREITHIENAEPAVLIFKEVWDKGFPEVRIAHKLKFQEILQENEGLVDQKVIDNMLKETVPMKKKVISSIFVCKS